MPPGDYSVTVDTGAGSPLEGFTNTADPDGGFDSTVAVTLTEGENNLDQDFGYEGLDLGDGPASYGTLVADGGASHFAIGPYFGAARDVETDGQPTAAADGDDLNSASDDEDGLTGGLAFTEGANASATLSYVNPAQGGPARVCGWLDPDDSGTFDAAELVSEIVNPGAGTVTLDFGTVPLAGGDRTSYARFQIGTPATTACNPGGFVPNGEVEDYVVDISERPLGSIGDTIYFDYDGNGQPDPGVPGVPGVTVTLGGDLDDVAVTGPNGEYLFTGIPAGSY